MTTKTLTGSEIGNLYCGLYATADALRKLGDTEGRAEWCEAMAKQLEAKMTNKHQWKINVRAKEDKRIHSFFVFAVDEDHAVANWILQHSDRFDVDDVVRVQRTDKIVTR